ncbi:MAG: hypothetical protein J5I90_19940 [Caldilineales bacterium]|nr:hypothetical protein [Caldilineales bacterium]
MKRFALAALALSFVILLAACGGAPVEPVRYTIDMTEYAFNPNTLEFKVGQDIEITLTNSGQLAHEIMFGRDVMKMNNRPAGFQTDLFAAGGVEPEVVMMESHDESGMDNHGEEDEMQHEGFMVLLPKGESQATMKFKVTPQMAGEWEMGCFEQDGVHYDAGMKGVVTISR